MNPKGPNPPIITPQEIPDRSFPSQPTPNVAIGSPSQNGTQSPQTIIDNPFPGTDTAEDVIGKSMNTKQRTLLQPFTFVQKGGFSIGNITIDQDGITAHDTDGNITFHLDAKTGKFTT